METKKICVEYVWIDAFDNTRSKLRVLELDKTTKEIKVPNWNFDGSSCGMATGFNSDIVLKPVSCYANPFITWCESYLVLCETFDKDGITPHTTNHRVKCVETYLKAIDSKPLFGIEQEYLIIDRDGVPYGWKNREEAGAGPQGPYYCGVGGDRVFGRSISNKHLEMCLKAGLKICGTNAEVMASQWEYQIGPVNPIEVSDQLWISRYILARVCEEYDCNVTFHPKPYTGDFNGSGGHTNFSTELMRESNGLTEIKAACEKLSHKHQAHMAVYGQNNHMRLTGLHETSSIYDFSWGVSDRGRSIRIPLNVATDGCGYLEDRRPAANLNPYLVTEIMLRTICLE
jgi:glutamine synthetase